jgi:hypothetical protein
MLRDLKGWHQECCVSHGFVQRTNGGAVSSWPLWSDIDGLLSFINLYIHDSHVLVDQGRRDGKELWSLRSCICSNVLGSIEIASPSASAEFRQVRLGFTYLPHGYSRFFLGIHTEAVQ